MLLLRSCITLLLLCASLAPAASIDKNLKNDVIHQVERVASSSIINNHNNNILGTTNFERDVIHRVERVARSRINNRNNNENNNNNNRLRDDLLSKAIPLKKYYQLHELMNASDYDSVEEGDYLDTDNNSRRRRRMEDGDDLYAMDENDMVSLDGYSIKYAKCQPVQKFSEDALENGDYSPMITQDIVVLRLCPYKACNKNRPYGCFYNYVEYALGITDYIGIMLQYAQDRQNSLCDWCNQCKNGNYNNNNNNNRNDDDDDDDDGGGDDDDDDYYNENDDVRRRKLNDAGEEEDNNNNAENNNGEENNEAEEGDEDNDDDDDDDQAANDDGNYNNNNNKNYNNNNCDEYSDYCADIWDDCNAEEEQEQNNDDNNGYLDANEYIDYVNCVEFDQYYVRPRCDTNDGTIKMGVYYNEECTRYAGKDGVDITSEESEFDVKFSEDAFVDFYDGTCYDCSESEVPPYFNDNSYMCNMVNHYGAKCEGNLGQDLFDNYYKNGNNKNKNYDDAEYVECAFIESIRYGTYDQNGEISIRYADDAQPQVTFGQKMTLLVSAACCVFFIVYSCYLHHAMTNLLIRSLSHNELLPPSRHKKRARLGKKRGIKRGVHAKANNKKMDDDDDDATEVDNEC